MKPIISVVMPTYNNSIYIKKAIDSVINQKVDYELLIIDDASTDNTYEVVKPYLSDRIKYIRNSKNMGVAYTRNVGIQLAVGKYVAFLDSDDWWKKDKLKEQLKILEDKNCIFCYTARELFNEDGIKLNKIIWVPRILNYKQLLKTNYIPCSSVVLRADIAKNIQVRHDEFHEDYLMWLRILKIYGKVYGINKPYLNTRLTRNGKSRHKLKTIKMTYGVYRCLGLNRIKSIYYLINHMIRSFMKYVK